MDKSLIQIFRGDDTDGLGYQSIQGKITTTLDLTGCRAVFRYLGFTQEFDPIPENGRITITMPASATSKFPPGLGYASLRVYDSNNKVRTFTNRIPVFVTVYAPSECGGEFEVVFNGGSLELEPLKIKSVNGYRIYDGYLEQIIDKATAIEYGLALLFDSGDLGKDANSGYAATPKAVQAAYDAIIGELTDNYYNAEETEEAIDRIAAYYITSDAQGNPFATYAALAGATVFYSGGQLRTPTRNDYCVVLADETHGGEQYRYIYSVNQQGAGQWEAQYAVGGSIELDNTVTRTSTNGVKSSGIWSAIWGALTAVPGVSSLYDWCVAQLAGKASTADATLTPIYPDWVILRDGVNITAQVQQPYYADDPDDALFDSWVVERSYIQGDGGESSLSLPRDAVSLSWIGFDSSDTRHTYTATRTRTLIGYTLGDQSDKLLQPKGDYALLSDIAVKSVKLNGTALTPDANGAVNVPALPLKGGRVTGNLHIGPQNDDSKRYRLYIHGMSPNGYWRVVDIESYGFGLTDENDNRYQIYFPSQGGTLALAAGTGHNGNLAMLDASGNPVDSGIAKTAVAPLASPAFTGAPTAPTPTAGDDSTKVATTAFVQAAVDEVPLRYNMPAAVALSPENDAATLVCADRAVTNAMIAAGFSTLNLTFPAAISGKVRDFYLRIVVAAGESAPALSIPQDITIENPDGAVPEIADGETSAASTTLVWFSETAPNVFTAKSETVKAVA